MKKKLLLENFLVYGLGQVVYKAIPLLLTPIITRVMLDSQYCLGIHDLFTTFVTLVSIIGLLGMYDALFRLSFDYDENDLEIRQRICSTAFGITSMASSVLALTVIVLRHTVSVFLFKDDKLGWLVVILAITIVLFNMENILLTPTRIDNDRKIYILGNTAVAIVSYGVALLFVLQGKCVIALPIGNLLGLCIGCFFFGLVNKRYFSVNKFSVEWIKPLLKIGIPLFPTFLIFWVYASFDRLMISKYIDIEANGIYSAANTLAKVSQLITTGFSAGWSFYTFSTMKDADHTKDFSKIVEYLLLAGVITFLPFRIFGEYILVLVFGVSYLAGGVAFSYLFFAPIVHLIFQIMGSQFLVIKKPIYTTVISILGVGLNIVLNYYWIQRYGIVGAAMATNLSYWVLIIVGSVFLYIHKLFIYSKKEIVLFVCYIVILIQDLNGLVGSFIPYSAILCIGVICLFYFKDFFIMLKGDLLRK